MNNKTISSTLVLFGVVILLVAVFTNIFHVQLHLDIKLVKGCLMVLASMAAGITVIMQTRQIGIGILQARTWFSVGLGFILWSLGMLYQTLHYIIIGKDAPTHPIGIHEIGFMLMYVLMVVAFYFQIKAYKNVIKFKPVMVLVILATAALYLWVVFGDQMSHSKVSHFTHFFYTIGSVIVVSGSLIMFFQTRGVAISRAWILLAISLFLITFNDSLGIMFRNIEMHSVQADMGIHTVSRQSWLDITTVVGFILAWAGSVILKDSYKA